MKYFKLKFLSVAFLLFCFLVTTQIQLFAKTKLTILLPFSSVYKALGDDAKNGFMLGVEKESKAANVDINKWIEFDIVDSRVDNKHALKKVKESIANGSKAVMGIVSSGVGLTIRDYVIKEKKLPLIVFAACGTSKLRTTNPLFLRYSFSNQHAGLGLSLYRQQNPTAYSKKKQPKYIDVFADYSAGYDFADGFDLIFKEYGKKLDQIPIPFKTLDKKKYFGQIKRLKPDIVFAFFAGAEADSFIKSWYQFKMNQKYTLLMSGDAFSPRLLKSYEQFSAKDTGVGAYYSTLWSVDLKNKTNQNFVTSYKQKYGKSPGGFGMSSYDAGRHLVKALVKLKGKWDGKAVMKLLRETPLKTPRHGYNLTFDVHGDPVNPEYIYVTEKKGKKIVPKLMGSIGEVNLDKYR